MKTENVGAQCIDGERYPVYAEGHVHSRGIRITSHTMLKPCCSCNARATSSPTFFNTLFVSLGIALPRLAPPPSPPSRYGYSPHHPECVSTAVCFPTHEDRAGRAQWAVSTDPSPSSWFTLEEPTKRIQAYVPTR